jgi:hypothetical protein
MSASKITVAVVECISLHKTKETYGCRPSIRINTHFFEAGVKKIHHSMKQVRFQDADSLCTVINESSIACILSTNDIKERWFTEDDYQIVNFDINHWSMKLQKNGQVKLLNQLVLYGEHDELIESTDFMPHLLEWAKLESCRGLETQLNVSHKIQRAKQRAKATFATLKIQVALQDQLDQEDRMEKIREESEKFTESAKRFALAMALADEKVLQLELNHQPSGTRHFSILHRLFAKRMPKSKI